MFAMKVGRCDRGHGAEKFSRAGVKENGLKQARLWWSEFSRLPPAHAAVEALAAISQPRNLAAGEILVNESDKDGTVFLTISGVLRTVRYTRNGHEVWYADVKPGDLTGDMAALTGARRTSTVVAKTASVVFTVERDAFLAVANRYADFAVAVARMLAFRLQTTSKHLAELVSLPVSTRLHGELAAMGSPSHGDGEVFEIQSPPKVVALSQRIHATREATSRALGDLEQRGLLKRGRAAWTVIVPADTGSLSPEIEP